MKAWQPKTVSPLAPGAYWCALREIVNVDSHGVRTVAYRDRGHIYFDGAKWQSDEFSHWHGEEIR